MSKDDDSAMGEWRAKIDVDRQDIGLLIVALLPQLENDCCEDCDDHAVELLERLLDIDEGLSIRTRLRVDV